jgi:hypothetical protein
MKIIEAKRKRDAIVNRPLGVKCTDDDILFCCAYAEHCEKYFVEVLEILKQAVDASPPNMVKESTIKLIKEANELRG